LKRLPFILIMVLLSNLFVVYLSAQASITGQMDVLDNSQDDFDYLLGDFEETTDGWIYGFGDNQPNIVGNFTSIESVDAYQGSYVGELMVDFTASDQYRGRHVRIEKELADVDIEKFAFWVKTSDLNSLVIRTTDATNQTFQRQVQLQDTSDWQQVIISQMGTQSMSHWGGANNGNWNGPATGVTIMIDSYDVKDNKQTASLLIANVTAQIVEKVIPQEFDDLLSDFEEQTDGWKYGFGDNQPKIKGGFKVIESDDARFGDYIGELTADFTKSDQSRGRHVSISKKWDDVDIE